MQKQNDLKISKQVEIFKAIMLLKAKKNLLITIPNLIAISLIMD
jgi:hypothetical protein